MSEDSPRVSVVIPSLYDVDGEYLKLCVESLRTSVDWQIIVVTNGGFKPNLRHIKGISTHLHVNKQGQCQAVNYGAQVVASNTNYLMISNSDMYYAPNWNKNLRFDHLVFSPNLIEPTNNAGSAPPFLKLDAGFTVEEFNKQKVDDFVQSHKDDKEETGFNLPFFIKRSLSNEIGGYDVKYDPWGSNSDTDLQTMINIAGVTPMRLRDVLVYHFSNKSGTFDASHQKYYQRNWDYFDKKFGFNRDQLGSDVWYNLKMLPEDVTQIKFNPKWKGKYGLA